MSTSTTGTKRLRNGRLTALVAITVYTALILTLILLSVALDWRIGG